jgi:hypothetical protein
MHPKAVHGGKYVKTFVDRGWTSIGHACGHISSTIKTRLCNINFLAQVSANRYYKNVLGKEPITGTPKDFLEQYPAHSHVGNLARRHDAKAMIAAIQQVEQEVKEREQINAQCSERIDRMTAEHHLNMDYLFTFGVRCEHRDELIRILQENTDHGGMSLQEAAALANARARLEEMTMPNLAHNINGSSGLDSFS